MYKIVFNHIDLLNDKVTKVRHKFYETEKAFNTYWKYHLRCTKFHNQSPYHYKWCYEIVASKNDDEIDRFPTKEELDVYRIAAHGRKS